MKKRVLGKGLDAIIPRGPDGMREYEHIVLSKINLNPNQPRKKFDTESLRGLTDSVREKGLIQPLLVRKVATGYELVAGERRLRAAKEAGLERVPAVVRSITEGEALELAIIENVQREDLNPLEIAEAYSSLAEEFGHSQEEIARKVGKERSTVTNYMRLLKLPLEIRKGLIEGKISFGHAKALLSISTDKEQREAFKKTVQRGLSVRETEALSKNIAKIGTKKHKSGYKTSIPVEVRDLIEGLQRRLGTKLVLKGSEVKGILEIHFSSSKELEKIVDKLNKDS